MKQQNKKRQILAATLVVALAAAVAVNWYYARLTPQTSTDASTVSNLGDSLLVAGTAQSAESTAPAEEATDEAAAAVAAMQQYFSEAQLNKQQYHDEMEDAIEDVLDSETLDAAGQQKVIALLSDLDSVCKAEADCENLIAAKLGGKCIVVIHDGAAQVVVENGRISESASLQIAEIVEKTAGISGENLTITEAK